MRLSVPESSSESSVPESPGLESFSPVREKNPTVGSVVGVPVGVDVVTAVSSSSSGVSFESPVPEASPEVSALETSIPEKTVRVDCVVGASSGVEGSLVREAGRSVTSFSSPKTAIGVGSAGVGGITGVLAATDLSLPESGRADANGRTRQSARTRKTGRRRLIETTPGVRGPPALLLFCCNQHEVPPPVRILLA